MRILISNLNKLTTTSQVIALLLPFGFVNSAKVIMNAENGYSEGYALVDMEYNAGKIVIHELDSMRFMNCYISVEETYDPK
jgi:RNA recognition motif-containing protein